MCRMASFFHHPQTGEILVWNLNSHSKTEEHFGLNPVGPYREGHYLPSGEIECRVLDEDGISQETCNKLMKSRFPTFLSFFRWALANDGVVGEVLNLNGLETAEGLTIPDGVKYLWLNSLKTAKGLMIPKGVTELSLNVLKTTKGLVIPDGVKWLSLGGLETAEGLVIPEDVEELWLNSLKTAKGLVISENIMELSLDSLETAKGLTIGKNTVVYAPKLSSEEKKKIKRIQVSVVKIKSSSTRDAVITKDDIVNLKILINSVNTVEDFINLM